MTAIAHTSPTVRLKEFHFPVSVGWLGERRVAASVHGKSPIEISPPPVFRGTDPTAWSPEDFFVAAAASCLAVTFTGLAGRAGLTYTSLNVDADGTAGQRPDGRFGFTGSSSDSRSKPTQPTPSRRACSPNRQNKPASSRRPSTCPSKP